MKKIPKFYQYKAAVGFEKTHIKTGSRLHRFEKWGNTMVGKLTQRLHKSKNGKKGFTLVELIVVIVIILILAAVMVPLLMNYIGQANKANAKSNAATVLTQIQADYAASEAGKYTDMTAPGSTGYTKINDVNIIKSADGNTATITDGTATPAAAYAVNTVTRTDTNGTGVGTSKYKEIVAFVYNDGQYYATWTMSDGWTVESGSDVKTVTNTVK